MSEIKKIEERIKQSRENCENPTFLQVSREDYDKLKEEFEEIDPGKNEDAEMRISGVHIISQGGGNG